MSGLMGRAKLILSAKANRALDAAEDPGEMLDLTYEQMLEQLPKMKEGVVGVTTAKKQLELQYNTLKQQADKLDEQARVALQNNREDLAREALTRKGAIQPQLDALMAQGQQLEAKEQSLIQAEKQLETKIAAFRTQKEVTKATYTAAEAEVRIGEAASGIGEHMADMGLALQRANDKVDQMTARANAIDELTQAGALSDSLGGGDDLDRQMAQLTATSQVDDQLAKMKAELGGGTPPMQLEAAS